MAQPSAAAGVLGGLGKLTELRQRLVFVFLALDETQRPSLYWGFGFIALCYGAYFLIHRKRQGVLAPSLPSA